MTYNEIKAAWNAQADEHNQWDELGEDEKVEWAAAYAVTNLQPRVPENLPTKAHLVKKFFHSPQPSEKETTMADPSYTNLAGDLT